MNYHIIKDNVVSDLRKVRKSENIKSLVSALLKGTGFRYVFYLRILRNPNTHFLNYLFRGGGYFLLRERRLVFINPSIPIGKGFMIGHCFDIIVDAERIGDNVKIMQQVTIGRSIGGNKSGIPVIGNNVFVGAGAKIIGNVKVGNNVIIGANSVVTKDIPDNAIVGGCPARVLSMNGEYEVKNWVKDLTVEK